MKTTTCSPSCCRRFLKWGAALSVGAAVSTAQAWNTADSDTDGLSDEWENYYFGNLSYNGADDNDNDGLPNSLEFSSDRNPTAAETVPGTPDWHAVPGALRFERWNNIAGDTLLQFYQSTAYRHSTPDSTGFRTTAEMPQNQGDNFGVRLRGTLRAPATGQYRFYIASDNQGELHLGTDGSRFTMRRLCRVDGYTGYRAWTANASQASVLVTLEEGQPYWFEASMKEGGGGDHLSVGWIRPGQSTIEVVPGKMPDGTVVLTSYAPDPLDLDDDGLPDSFEAAAGLDPNSRTDHALIDSDGDGVNNLTEYQNGTPPVPLPGQAGYCQWDAFFIGSNNSTIKALTHNPLFAQTPGLSGYFSTPEAGQNWGDNFGRRIRGVITIPTSGAWRFYISGDNCTSLLINPDGVSRFGKSQVAFNSGASSFRSFSTGTARSQTFNFIAGHKIYFEALYVETYGNDHCSVGWSGPGFASATLIPSSAISVCEPETITIDDVTYNNDSDNDSLPDDWELTQGLLVTNSGSGAWENGEHGDPDGDGLTNLQEYQNGTNPLTANGIVGYWAHQWFGSLGGSRISDLIGAPGLLRAPDMERLSDSTEFFRSTNMVNYGQRFRATLTAPRSGDYTFWLSGDDEAELWISTDDRKFNKRRILFSAYGAYRNWESNVGRKSAPVTLEEGESYFIEVLHKQGAGADHVSVAWSFNSTNWAQTGAGATATQSTTLNGMAASRAIDGNCSMTSGSNSMSHTTNVANSWFEVDFGRDCPVSRVVLFNRDDEMLRTRLSNFRISLRDASGNELSGGAANFFEGTGYAPLIFNWDLPATITARKVRVQLLGNNNDGNGYLALAEVQAFEIGSEAWPATPLPSSALTSFIRDADDLEDDYLPDAWELQYGLSPEDNGKTLADNGEYGDPDADGLTNRDEWLLGTNPVNADTDGDGYSDGQEVYFMGTNPLVPELAQPSVVGEVAGIGQAGASADWVETADGGLLSMETRGWIDYDITVDSAGYYIFEIRGRARGSAIRPREDFPLDVYVNSKRVASTTLTSLNGQSGLASGFAGWLGAGTHTLRIWNRNLLGRRALQLDSIRLVKPSGEDLDADGLPDWIYEFLTARNLVSTGSSSLVSPFCIEGTSRDVAGTTISVNNSAATPVAKGADESWFANVPLSASAAVPVTIGFENGLLQQDVDLEWLPLNIAQQPHMVIRRNDSLRLTGFTPGTPPGTSNVVLAVNGQTIATTPANQPFIRQFTASGLFTVSATFTGSNGQETATMTVEVVSADFGSPFYIYMRRARQWTLSQVPFALPLEHDRALMLNPQPIRWSGRSFLVDSTAIGTNTVIARANPGGPVAAAGKVEAILVSQSGDYELPQIYAYPNGDTIVEHTVMVTGLPPGGYVELEFFLGGRSFLDGTIRKRLYADDFDPNGIARVPMIFSSGIGTTCHRTFLREANGTIIGQM